jgi:probable phosphoglycerate mutase
MKLGNLFYVVLLISYSPVLASSVSDHAASSSQVTKSLYQQQVLLNKEPFYFMRHAKTEWNARGVYMGAQDIPINAEGMEQAEAASSILENREIKYIVTGPLSRTHTTAEILANKLKKQVLIIEEFRQCSWGCKEGAPFDDGTMINNWLLGETPNGAETAKDFHSRVLRGLEVVLKLDGPVLIVSHGGVYRAIRRIIGAPALNIDHCDPYLHLPSTDNEGQWTIYGNGADLIYEGARKKSRNSIDSEDTQEHFPQKAEESTQ